MDAYFSMMRCPNIVNEKPCTGGLLVEMPEDNDLSREDLMLGCGECGLRVSLKEQGDKVSGEMSGYMQKMMLSLGGVEGMKKLSKEQQYNMALESVKHTLSYFPPINLTPTRLLATLHRNAW